MPDVFCSLVEFFLEGFGCPKASSMSSKVIGASGDFYRVGKPTKGLLNTVNFSVIFFMQSTFLSFLFSKFLIESICGPSEFYVVKAFRGLLSPNDFQEVLSSKKAL